MAQRATPELFDKIKYLLKVRGFVSEELNHDNKHRFGPPGLLLRRNIGRIWWEWMVTSQKRTYPVETGLSDNATKDGQGNEMRINLSKGCLQHYLDVSALANKAVPFTIAQSGVRFTAGTKEHDDKQILLNSTIGTELLTQHYCNPDRATQYFDQCVNLRLQWWRNFAEHPSSFREVEAETDPEGNTVVNITYPFPWGDDHVECITNRGSAPLKELQATTKEDVTCVMKKKSGLPCIVECSTSLERGMLAFILDAYTEKNLTLGSQGDTSSSAEQRTFLQFHNSLAPYSVSIATDGRVSGDMAIVVNHIGNEVRNAGISILDVTNDSCTLEEQFRRNDEMGIPFTAVVDEQTKMDGRIFIRYRDTSIKEEMHITGLTDFLKKEIQEEELS